MDVCGYNPTRAKIDRTWFQICGGRDDGERGACQRAPAGVTAGYSLVRTRFE